MPIFALGLGLALLVGLSLGLLGGGGSILTVPLLHYVMGQSAHAAVAGSLLVVGTTAIVALLPHARAGRVRWKTGLGFGLASMVGAYGGGRVARFVPPTVLLIAFGVMMLATAIAMLRKPKRPAVARERARSSWMLVAVEGLVVGAVTGLVGAGGGFLVVPALVVLGGLPIAEAVGTSLLVIGMKSFAAFAGSAGSVALDLPLLGAVAVVAVLGSVLGARLVAKVPAAQLQAAFGWFVVVMSVVVLGQELPRIL